MAETTGMRKVAYMFVGMSLLLISILIVLSITEGIITGFVFVFIFGVMGSFFHAFQSYYSKMLYLVCRCGLALLATWIVLWLVQKVEWMSLLLCFCVILFYVPLTWIITHRAICPTSSILVYDSEDNRNKAKELALDYRYSVDILLEFEYKDDWNELSRLAEYVEIFKIPQICACLDTDEYKLLRFCKEKGMSIVMDAPVSKQNKNEFHLHRMEHLGNKIFSLMVF